MIKNTFSFILKAIFSFACYILCFLWFYFMCFGWFVDSAPFPLDYNTLIFVMGGVISLGLASFILSFFLTEFFGALLNTKSEG